MNGNQCSCGTITRLCKVMLGILTLNFTRYTANDFDLFLPEFFAQASKFVLSYAVLLVQIEIVISLKSIGYSRFLFSFHFLFVMVNLSIHVTLAGKILLWKSPRFF